jgi:hypothetical protein
VVERDATVGEQRRHHARILRRDAAELDAVRQHEHVRSEAMPAVVRRLPEPIGLDMGRERVEDRYSEPRTAAISAAVRAHEKQQALERRGVAVGRDAAKRAVAVVDLGSECDLWSVAAVRATEEQHAPLEAHGRFLPPTVERRLFAERVTPQRPRCRREGMPVAVPASGSPADARRRTSLVTNSPS